MNDEDHPVRWFVLNIEAITEIDITGEDALDEVALEREEDEQRNQHRQKRAGADDVDVRRERAHLFLQRVRDGRLVEAEDERHQ